ncbi:MAG: glycoside hydrolase family 78 protein [Actinobacteria bacterium]|nr:glycoside hydrolase family 78 protein [Actinomycetota bacterium]
MTTPTLQANHLSCEHRCNPLGVDVGWPRLSWVLESERRDQKQSAYQILVAGSEEDLQTEENLLWDSGEVASDRSVGIEYGGQEFHSGSRCLWKVRVWDGLGNPSPYSNPAMWEMGLLETSDWMGHWISLGEGAAGDVQPPTGEKFDDVLMGLAPCPYLRKEFSLERAVRKARLYATARGVYELHLNGRKVGHDVLSPGWTDYNKRIQYQTYDVTGMLVEGQNTLGGILSDGWYAGFVGMDPKRRGAHYGTRSQLLAQLNVEYEGGDTESIASDESWKSSLGPIEFSDLLMGESYDARKEQEGWAQPGFDDSGWWPVHSLEDLGDARLVAEPDEGVRVIREVETKKVTQPKSGTYVFDLGQNMVGWVRLKVRGKAGTRVTLRHAEALNPDGTIYTVNLRTARQTDSYILKGGGEEVFEPRFTFHGFRYVEVTGYPGEPPLDAITGRVVHSAMLPSGSFECSNTMVNRLQSNIIWGQRSNFVSVPTDCPQRDERLGWMGDAQVFVRTASFNMDVSAFFTKWMRDVEDAQSPEGAFPDVAPLLSDLSLLDLSNGAPAWGDAGVIVPWTIYRTYEDTRIIERHYGAMARWMEYLREANPTLLRTKGVGNNYGDWLSPGSDDTPKDLLATAYWAYDAKLMAEMAQAIECRDVEEYEKLFREIKDAFTEAYVSPDGRVKGDTQTCYVLALHMGLLPDDLREAAAGHLVEAIERKDWHLSTGFVGVGYVCPVLTETGYTEVAYRLLNNDTFPSWGYTLRQGATTIWERWDGWTEENGFQSPNMNSFNHYSLGSIGEWLYRYVAGIDQASRSTGYKQLVIRPRPGGDLTSARAEYDSIRGRITSEWEISDGRFRLHAIIPANTTAKIYVPVSDGTEVTESGRSLDRAEGVELLHVEDGEAIVTVGSGSYEFVGSMR